MLLNFQKFKSNITLKPIVGIVLIFSLSFTLYKMVVLPALSRPSKSIRFGTPSFHSEKSSKSLVTYKPILIINLNFSLFDLNSFSKYLVHIYVENLLISYVTIRKTRWKILNLKKKGYKGF